MNTNRSRALAVVAAKSALGATLALGLALSPHGMAAARADTTICTADGQCDRYVDAVPLSQYPDIDTYPVCQTEDCSDVDGIAEDTPGIWVDPDTGNSYLTFGRRSLLIVDDTVR